MWSVPSISVDVLALFNHYFHKKLSLYIHVPNTGCPINMETHSTLTFSVFISAIAKVKPLLKSLDSNLQGLDFDFFQKTKHYRNLFWRHAPTPFFKMSQDFVFQIYVLLYFFKSMYPGIGIWTWAAKMRDLAFVCGLDTRHNDCPVKCAKNLQLKWGHTSTRFWSLWCNGWSWVFLWSCHRISVQNISKVNVLFVG